MNRLKNYRREIGVYFRKVLTFDVYRPRKAKKNNGITEKRDLMTINITALGNGMCELEIIKKREKITCSHDAFEIFKYLICDAYHGEFWIILLNSTNMVIKKIKVSEGGLNGSTVNPVTIFKRCLDYKASSFIIGHNHPSGCIQPSEADKKITKKIKDSGFMLDIPMLDHIIVGHNEYYSFKEEGVL